MSVVPPTPRSFHLPLSSEQDQSHLSSRIHTASVSATANPTRAASRQMRAKTQQQQQEANGGKANRSPNNDNARQKRRKSEVPEEQEATVAATAAAAASAFAATPSMAASSSSSSLAAAVSPPLPPAASASPVHVDPFLHGGTSLTDADRATLDALSSDMHEDERRAFMSARIAAIAMRQAQELHIADPAPAAAAVAEEVTRTLLPPAPVPQQQQQQRRMPTLPPAQLKSLVRSHVRHVGLSSRLKTRTHVRELRDEALTERKAKQTLAVKAAYGLVPAPAAMEGGSSAANNHGRRRAKRKAATGDGASPPNPPSFQLSNLDLSASSSTRLPPPAAAAASDPTSSSAPAVIPWPSWLPDTAAATAALPAPHLPPAASISSPRLFPALPHAPSAAGLTSSVGAAVSPRMPPIQPSARAQLKSRLLKGSFAPPLQ